jgi:hypothetical protein
MYVFFKPSTFSCGFDQDSIKKGGSLTMCGNFSFVNDVKSGNSGFYFVLLKITREKV